MKPKYLSFVLLFGLIVSCSQNTKGIKVCLANDLIKDYWDNYYEGYSSEYMEQCDQYYPKPFHYEFDNKENVTNREIYLSTNKNMDNARKYITSSSAIDIENLYANTTYYVKTCEYSGNQLVSESKAQKYYTMDYPRTIKLSSISNTRDIGSLSVGKGHRLAQGKIYRGANLDSISDDDIDTMTGELGIKTDLDLRAEGEGTAGTGSPLGNVNYINISGVLYVSGDRGIKYSLNKETIKNEIKVFANKDNYPIYFHCAVGRDRTGTLGIILEALLGVDKETILKEYELSFFSKAAYLTDTTVEYMVSCAEEVINYIVITGQEDVNDTLSQSTENWLINKIGVTQEEINTIKEIMIV